VNSHPCFSLAAHPGEARGSEGTGDMGEDEQRAPNDLAPAMTLLDVCNIPPEDSLGQSFFMV
jgi:hypothetical protein